MTAEVLTPEGRERFERDGFLRVEGALSGADPLHLLAFVGEDRAFLELLDHPATLPIVVDVLGWNIFMYHCHLDVHPPAEGDGHATCRSRSRTS